MSPSPHEEFGEAITSLIDSQIVNMDKITEALTLIVEQALEDAES